MGEFNANDMIQSSPVDSREAPQPFAPLAGNARDDDGIALDEYFEAASQGAQVFTGAIPMQEDLHTTTRILSRSLTLVANSEPMLFYPPDPRRLSVTISVGANDTAGTPYTGLESIRLGTSKSDCYGAADIPLVSLSSNPLVISDYTGGVWLMNPGVNARSISVLAHTR